ncbi:hypothetical protein [Bacillus sp. CGMCC 1.16541]|uniref:hypothetical protein n=1 Tax=Bacillus sp. CGMCC 1.16541 TaxID=2185143 RepID=UPI000D7394F8|nr:hypothetical protein [Bacillus sp. CGMCC 1.16541]
MDWINSLHKDVSLKGQRDHEDVDTLVHSFLSRMTKEQLTSVIQTMSREDIHSVLFPYVQQKVEETF